MSQANPEVTFINVPAPPRKLTFQFTIRGALILTAIFAATLGAIIVPELFALIFGFAYVALTTAIATSILCARGWFRAFSCGAAIPHILLYPIMFSGPGAEEFLAAMFALFIASVVAGGIAAITHGFFARRGGLLKVPNVPLLRKWLTND